MSAPTPASARERAPSRPRWGAPGPARRRGTGAGLAPVLNSAVVIGVFIAFGRMVPGAKDDPAAVADAAVALLGWGTTAGVAVMSLPLLWPVHRTGVRLRPTLT